MVIHGEGKSPVRPTQAFILHTSHWTQAIIVPPTWIAMMIWAFIRVPSSEGLFKEQTSLEGAALSWAWLSALNSALGLYSTLAVNIPDFTVGTGSFCVSTGYL